MTPQTPMLRQYFATKERHPGVLLAMRVGDFYEFYGEDAEIAARELEITLTGREDGSNGRIPMSGVPFHSVEKYLARLISKGMKVAICDQIEDPKQAKGLVKRAVTRVMTPGTALEDSMLPTGANNFLASAAVTDEAVGVSFLDLSTGEFLVTEVAGFDSQERTLQEIARLNPAECLLPEEAAELNELIAKVCAAAVTTLPFLKPKDAKSRLLRQFKTHSLSPFGVERMDAGASAAGTILSYLDGNEIRTEHIDHVVTYSLDEKMRLDYATQRSLELSSNISDGGRRMTLIEVLDKTKTPMGARTLKRWIEEPLLDRQAIESRLDSVEKLRNNNLAREEVRAVLGKLYDIHRLTARAATGVANPRDIASLRESLIAIPDLIERTAVLSSGRLTEVREEIDTFEDLVGELNRSIVADPPVHVRDGGVIRRGYDAELDEYKRLASEGKAILAQLETAEREKTGIDRLKIGYNSVFGYYLDIPKTKLSLVPPEYIRKQTTANSERYITVELKELEARVLGAEEKSLDLEASLFAKVRAMVAQHAPSLLKTARAIAEIDVLQSLGHVASVERYSRPKIEDSRALNICAGRHPVVETHAGMGSFVPNDLRLGDDRHVVILTGPNMSGKSTYLRQNALIVLMAQMGSFVPAESAVVGIVDRVFARIGARDELATGQSTFMVEMTEAAHILHHATDRSLVILDEIGRGTSTFDGLAIAWAIAERLNQIGAKTLFATHYHQLNELADRTPGVVNFRVAVREDQDRIVWLHKVLEGGTDKSYGIQVAKMAGVPRSVLNRAQEVLSDLERSEPLPAGSSIRDSNLQMRLFELDVPEAVKRLRKIDTQQITPVEALVLLDSLKRECMEES